MALLLSGLSSTAFVLPTVLPARVTVTMQQQQQYPPPGYGGPGTAYGQPSIAGLTREQVMANARKAAGKDPNYDPKMKGDGQAKNNVVTGGWGTLD